MPTSIEVRIDGENTLPEHKLKSKMSLQTQLRLWPCTTAHPSQSNRVMKTKKIVAFLAFCAVSATAVSQDYPSPSSQQTSANPGARYEIIQSPLAAKWTFRLDRFSGRVWQLVKTKDNDSTWEEMSVYELPKLASASRARFQLFTSGLAARHTFIVDSDSGKTWLLVTGKRTNNDGTDSQVSSWQPFAE